MGWPYGFLFTPAFLHAHPDVTREELLGLLGNTPHPHARYIALGGLYQLARELDLPHTREYEDLQEKCTHPLYGYARERFLTSDEGELTYTVEQFTHELGKPERFADWFDDKPEPGRLIDIGYQNAVVLEVEYAREHIDDDECLCYESAFTGQPVWLYKASREFDTIDELASTFPQYHPDSIYDFSTPTGVFMLPSSGEQEFRWLMRDGRYRFDMEGFMRSAPAMTKLHQYSYVDFTVCMEAVKTGSWQYIDYLHDGIPMNMLLRDTTTLATDFLKDHPASKAAYDRAVWDSHTSEYAKKHRLNHSDLLRMRLLGSQFFEHNT